MAAFSRHSRTKRHRPLQFVNDLPQLHDTHLPERPKIGVSFSIGPASDWRTLRFRPEILAIIDGLRERSARTADDMLSTNEVVAALIIAGLPVITEAPHGPFSRHS